MDASTLIVPLLTFPAITGFALIVIRFAAGDPSKYLDRLSTYGRQGRHVLQGDPTSATSILRQREFSRIRFFQSILSASSFADRLQNDLAQAGIPLRVGEYFTLRGLVAIATCLPVFILSLPPILMIPVAIVGFFLPELYLRRRQSQRLQKFNDSLVDALSLMANAMKSGSSFLQALDLVARELPAPLGEEFGRVVTEISVGTPVEAAMTNLSKRVQSYDVFLMVTAVLIQRETGGNLAEILDSISSTIRDRIKLLRQVQVLTAQERMGAILVGSLPVVMGVMFSIISPEYTKPLIEQTLGRFMLAAAAGLEIIGFVVMSRVSKIEV